MISIIRILFISSILLIAGCAGNSFSIEFDLPADINANYTVAYYASDKRGGIMVETVAPVANGKCIVQGQTVNPAIVFLSSGKYSLPIYVRRGDEIKISGDSPNPFSWMVEGNDMDEEWSGWRNENADELVKNDPDVTNRLIASYVTQNPESPISTLLLLTSFSRAHDEPRFRSLWLKLENQARDPEWSALIGRADQPDSYVRTPGKLKSMTVRSLHHGVDTIRTDSARASILFFWNAGTSSRKEHIDSLKALSSEFPDSSSRIIADICLEADSISWRSPLRSDSLKNVVRGWLPAGAADRRLIELQVTKSPFYIVFSPDGNQRYRGDSIQAALNTFRLLMKQ